MRLTTPAHAGWSAGPAEELTRASLHQLFTNQIPFIRLRNFASVAECEQLVKQAGRYGFSPYRGVEPQINKIGITVFEYNRLSQERYFSDAAAATTQLQDIFDNSFDPIERLMGQIQHAGMHAIVARRGNGQPYYAGLVRRIENGTLLHIDFAPAEQQEWEVAGITHQLAWNLYLRTSEDQGKTHIYNRQWTPQDDVFRDGTYGYDPQVAAGCQQISFQPRPGELVIFNTRNFHYVDPTPDERVTVTSAIGRISDDETVFWS
ncbi:hypothetical protein C2I19_10365 [Chromobacterium alticapitis]|uniref:Prolyl 4-hydroxylase alpha subunit Fe(2+) 2OG dioxygenase domain-containing protein n=1 Tax=Chromobacterium alticapitis TaxID=2073169 RepID=A0A2S5DGD6_9NEIS|nr:hypothetical protein C2I19_10365 [Chromobacterium alticapitis]